MKFISLVVLEQLNIPNALGPFARAASKPAAARWSASSQEAGRRRPPSLTSGSVRRRSPSSIDHTLQRGWVGANEVPDAVEATLELVLRLCVGEPDEALAGFAKGGPGQHGHARLAEQPVGQLALVEARPLDVREGVKRALGPVAPDARDRVEAVDDQVPPVLEHLHHSRNR